MNKRNKQFPPAPDFIRSDALPDAGAASAEDFAQHLADLLRTQTTHAKDAAAQSPAAEAAMPDGTLTPSAGLHGDARPVPGDTPVPSARAREDAAAAAPAAQTEALSDTLADLPNVMPSAAVSAPASDTTSRRPTRRRQRHAPRRGVPLHPARLGLTPSAQKLPAQDAPEDVETGLALRPDLSDAPFAPPEKDPSLAELFQLPATESPADETPDAAEQCTPEQPDALPPTPADATEFPVALTQASEDFPDETSEDFPDEASDYLAFLARAEAAADEPPVPAPLPDEPPVPAPLPEENTGPLPTLEELFGPDEPKDEDAPAEPEPLPRAEPEASDPARGAVPPPAPPRRVGRLRKLLRGLLAPQSPDEYLEESLEESPDDAAPAAPVPHPPTESESAEDLAVSVPDAAPAPAEDEPAPADAPKDEKPEAGSPAAAVSAPAEDDLETMLSRLAHLFETAPFSAPEPAPEADAAPEAEPAPDEDAAPEAEPNPAERSRGKDAARKAAPRPQAQTKHGKGSGPMRLDELMAAAIPMEELPPPAAPAPQPEPAAKPAGPSHGRKQKHAASRAAASAAAAAGAAVGAAEARAATEAAPGEARVPVPKPSAHAAEAERTRHAPSARQKEEKPADPVPSADARKRASAAREASREAGREPRPRPHLAPPAPEEPAVLRPEDAYRRYARPLDLIGTRLILTGSLTILSLFFTLYLSRHWTFLPEAFSGGITVFIQFVLLFMIVLSNRKILFRRHQNGYGAQLSLLLSLAALFTAADCFHAATELRSPFTVVFGTLMIVFLWGEYDRGMAMTTTVKVLRADQLSAGVSEVSEIGRNGRGLIRTRPNPERFMEKLETRDLAARVMRVYTATAAFCALAMTLLIGLGLHRDIAWTGTLILLGGVPVSGLLAYPRLYLLLSRRLAAADAALCGYHGAEVFGGDHAILISDEDLFPAGSLTLNGFKIYHSNPDLIVAYAAAAARSSASALDPVFDDLLVTHNGRRYGVDNFRFYDSGGIGASIGEDVVLMGSLEFMRRMGVHMDRGAKVKQAVYMSLNGELAAVFAIRYAPPDMLRKGLASIAANRHFKGILVTRTFLGTPGFLKAKFGIPAETFHYPSTPERIRLSETRRKHTGAQGAILARDSFAGFAQSVAAGRMLRSTTLGAAILTVLNGLTGLILTGVLALLPAPETATALNLLLYCVIWLAPTLLLTVWGRHF